MTLSDLITRLETAEGPNYKLDHEISVAIGRPANWVGFQLPAYTASLDASMTLVPEGAVWRVECHPVCGISALCDSEQSYAATPALALAAAALRARKEM